MTNDLGCSAAVAAFDQLFVAGALVDAEMWVAKAELVRGMPRRRHDETIALFAEFRGAVQGWDATMRWLIADRWGEQILDVRDLDQDLSDRVSASHARYGDCAGALSEGWFLVRWIDITHRRMMASCSEVHQIVAERDPAAVPAVMRAWVDLGRPSVWAHRWSRETYRDLARCVWEPSVPTAGMPSWDVAVERGSVVILKWMADLEAAGFAATEREEVLAERERAYEQQAGGALRVAACAAYRAQSATYPAEPAAAWWDLPERSA